MKVKVREESIRENASTNKKKQKKRDTAKSQNGIGCLDSA